MDLPKTDMNNDTRFSDFSNERETIFRFGGLSEVDNGENKRTLDDLSPKSNDPKALYGCRNFS
jgi:hypothetical protein